MAFFRTASSGTYRSFACTTSDKEVQTNAETTLALERISPMDYSRHSGQVQALTRTNIFLSGLAKLWKTKYIRDLHRKEREIEMLNERDFWSRKNYQNLRRNHETKVKTLQQQIDDLRRDLAFIRRQKCSEAKDNTDVDALILHHQQEKSRIAAATNHQLQDLSRISEGKHQNLQNRNEQLRKEVHTANDTLREKTKDYLEIQEIAKNLSNSLNIANGKLDNKDKESNASHERSEQLKKSLDDLNNKVRKKDEEFHDHEEQTKQLKRDLDNARDALRRREEECQEHVARKQKAETIAETDKNDWTKANSDLQQLSAVHAKCKAISHDNAQAMDVDDTPTDPSVDNAEFMDIDSPIEILEGKLRTALQEKEDLKEALRTTSNNDLPEEKMRRMENDLRQEIEASFREELGALRTMIRAKDQEIVRLGNQGSQDDALQRCQAELERSKKEIHDLQIKLVTQRNETTNAPTAKGGNTPGKDSSNLAAELRSIKSRNSKLVGDNKKLNERYEGMMKTLQRRDPNYANERQEFHKTISDLEVEVATLRDQLKFLQEKLDEAMKPSTQAVPGTSTASGAALSGTKRNRDYGKKKEDKKDGDDDDEDEDEEKRERKKNHQDNDDEQTARDLNKRELDLRDARDGKKKEE